MDALGRLFVQRVTQPSMQAVHLHAHVTAVQWHDDADVLVALSQDKMVSPHLHPASCQLSHTSVKQRVDLRGPQGVQGQVMHTLVCLLISPKTCRTYI